MDLATLIGLVAGSGLLMISIVLGGSPLLFVDVASILIVLGGMICSTLINYPLGEVLGIFGAVRKAFLHKAAAPEEMIAKLVSYATIARREGILALESHSSTAGDEFLRKGIQLAIDGTSPELIKDMLATELAFMEERHGTGQAILNTMGVYAPAFGMIGTLIGLIAMLANLDDPSQIGAGMAVALITTLYGAVLANLILIPLAGKLKVRTARELLTKQLIIEGILSIQSGDNPRMVEQKLKLFIAPSDRDRVAVATGK